MAVRAKDIEDDGNDALSGKETEEDSSGSESEEDDFFANLTPEQIELVRKRQEALKKGFQQFSSRREIDNIKELTTGFGLNEDEAKVALEICKDDEIECKRRLTLESDEFKEMIRDTILLKKYPRRRKRSRTQKPSSNGNIHTDPTIKVKIEINTDKKKGKSLINMDLKNLIMAQAKKSSRKIIKKGFKVNGEKRAKNLRLTEALALLKENKEEDSLSSNSTLNEDYVIVDGVTYKRSDLEKLEWSEARIKSFMSINTNPNSYYYRFNHPGEEHRTGEWSKEEVELFMEGIKDGCNYRWGEFSMKIKGRVGYQCSNFYRKLIQEGKITDPNYVQIDGKLKFLGKDGKRFTRKKEDAERKKRLKEERERAKALKRLNQTEKPKKKRKRKRSSRSRRSRGEDVLVASSSEDSDSEFDTEVRGVELIKGLKCPMTFKTVLNPALSPFGHIMSYDTWVRVLFKNKNRCPFTNQRLTRRALIKLTQDNVKYHFEAIKKMKPDFKETDLAC